MGCHMPLHMGQQENLLTTQMPPIQGPINPLLQIQQTGFNPLTAPFIQNRLPQAVTGLFGAHMMYPPTSVANRLINSPFGHGIPIAGQPASPWSLLRPDKTGSLDLRKTSIDALRVKAKEYSTGLEAKAESA